MYLLLPGRHHLLTRYQKEYLNRLVKDGLSEVKDHLGNPLQISEFPTAIIFVVTSANHNNTRRNPLPLYKRAMMIQDFSRDLEIPIFVIPIDDIGQSPNFASYTIKKIEAESEMSLSLTPKNTIVLCSTPVANLYSDLGFSILPVERVPGREEKFNTKLPWEILEGLAGPNEKMNPKTKVDLVSYMDPASVRLWDVYNVWDKIQMLFSDSLIGEDGDITESRDYNTYVREMDAIAELKFNETQNYILPGRIGDIGCAVGSWIKLASEKPNLFESDFYGVEIARHLFQVCEQRKENGEFPNPNVFFLRKNAVSGLVFPAGTMNTIHSSSLTHEIESYGNREKLLSFIKNRYFELTMGGVWINRDVVGPEDKDREVFVWFQDTDGTNLGEEPKSYPNLKEYLDSLSTKERFFRFQSDFRKEEGYLLRTEVFFVDGIEYLRMKLADVCEFLSKKDYTDNWESEMHESFCFWSFSDWKSHLESVGFQVSHQSHSYRNEWLVENRYLGKTKIFTSSKDIPKSQEDLVPMDFPVTHMLILAEK
ncbi:transferase [Leptospira congkakensis]|uniref:Transferase n=1 Tax=Leptospira congkakensis TaxID=2484932 RepID=A0A4Z1A5U6_9LEPT|nr:transferase [Leptospira congkakensis]TGL86272.1 transferase [Leptospira congkakensis]TGL94183.1 transferase [Leptospira congkakensis]TGL94408.1 transferase [Leptospira congkakensis]